VAADIKFIVGYVDGDGDDKGVTADNMVGFKNKRRKLFVDLDVPVNVTNDRMGQTQQATNSLSRPVLSWDIRATLHQNIFARPPMNQSPHTSYEFAKYRQNNTE